MICYLAFFAMTICQVDNSNDDLAEFMVKLDEISGHRWDIEFDPCLNAVVATSHAMVPEGFEQNPLTAPMEILAAQKSINLRNEVRISATQTPETIEEFHKAKLEFDKLSKEAPKKPFTKRNSIHTPLKEDYVFQIRLATAKSKLEKLSPPQYKFRSLLLQMPALYGYFDDRSPEARQLDNDYLAIFELLESVKGTR